MIARDPQFQHRMPWISKDRLDADMLPFPVKISETELPMPTRAPNLGQDTDAILSRVAGYDPARIKSLRSDKVVF